MVVHGLLWKILARPWTPAFGLGYPFEKIFSSVLRTLSMHLLPAMQQAQWLRQALAIKRTADTSNTTVRLELKGAEGVTVLTSQWLRR